MTDDIVVKDSNGTQLLDGDSVQVIKDLKVKGSSVTLKRGTLIRNIRLNGEDVAHWSSKRFDAIRGRHISLIPQDPTSSLNPVKTIGSQVGEIGRASCRERVSSPV